MFSTIHSIKPIQKKIKHPDSKITPGMDAHHLVRDVTKKIQQQHMKHEFKMIQSLGCWNLVSGLSDALPAVCLETQP